MNGDKFLFSSTWEVETGRRVKNSRPASFSFIVSLRPAWETVTNKKQSKRKKKKKEYLLKTFGWLVGMWGRSMRK